MSNDLRVTLLFDPFAISSCDGHRVGDFAAELQAFRDIEYLLQRDPRYETVQPKTYIVEGRCWEHFRSYHGVRGIRIEELTPRTRLHDWFQAEPPHWLTNEDIVNLGLLKRPRPLEMVAEDWAATIANWLIPTIAAATTFQDWLRAAAVTSDYPDKVLVEPLQTWFETSLATVAASALSSPDLIERLKTGLRESSSPVEFARKWLHRKALSPLAGYGTDNVLRTSGIDAGTATDRILAKSLPLVFPLPPPLHSDVSDTMRKAVRNARMQYRQRFEDAVVRLNALWDGLGDELRIWLEMEPRALTHKAATHLQQLPGAAGNDQIRRLISFYTPPEQVGDWINLQVGFEAWVAAYADYLRHCYMRRELPEAKADPASPFSRWLREYCVGVHNDPEFGYPRLARQVKDALSHGRTVVLVMVDALAVHLLREAVGYFRDYLKEEPTWSSYLIAPVPTITEVCKEAVLTGWPPSQCGKKLLTSLCRAYAIPGDQVQMAASWQDGERLQINENTRLIVYRDNRLDEEVHRPGNNYPVLLEQSAGIFRRLAELVTRWVEDFRCRDQTPPVVLVTADHGFTYGPSPSYDSGLPQKRDGRHRCVALTGRPSDRDLADDTLIYLNRDRFSLSVSYLAAWGRQFGRDTVSGWTMSHGGLLPEEVVIPVVEWFGDRAALAWPTVTFPDGAEFDQDRWILSLLLKNEHVLPVHAGTLEVRIGGSEAAVACSFSRLEPGQFQACEVLLPGLNIPEGVSLQVEVFMRQRLPKGDEQVKQAEEHLVPRAKRLMERTTEQSEFESMF